MLYRCFDRCDDCVKCTRPELEQYVDMVGHDNVGIEIVSTFVSITQNHATCCRSYSWIGKRWTSLPRRKRCVISALCAVVKPRKTRRPAFVSIHEHLITRLAAPSKGEKMQNGPKGPLLRGLRTDLKVRCYVVY